jgi:hypothetical protein
MNVFYVSIQHAYHKEYCRGMQVAILHVSFLCMSTVVFVNKRDLCFTIAYFVQRVNIIFTWFRTCCKTVFSVTISDHPRGLFEQLIYNVHTNTYLP